MQIFFLSQVLKGVRQVLCIHYMSLDLKTLVIYILPGMDEHLAQFGGSGDSVVFIGVAQSVRT